MKNEFKSITVYADATLEWKYGQEPEVTRAIRDFDNDCVDIRQVEAPELVALAERIAEVASTVAHSPREFSEISYTPATRCLKGGCWWNGPQGVHLVPFRDEILEKIASAIS